MNVVLVEPEIPFNTGNIGRTCVGTRTTLHLAGRLGFSLDGSEIRRSGLDYWPHLDLKVHAAPEDFLRSLPEGAPLFLFTTKAERSFWEVRYPPGAYLVFGSESRGLPPEWLARFRDRLVRIPIVSDHVRSLNLSSSAAVALFEALRQNYAPRGL